MSKAADLFITPQVLLKAYACGIFPMAESAEDENIFWVEPEERGILPLEEFHISKSLRKTMRSSSFDVRINRDFDGVISGCAASRKDSDVTWINQQIRQLYTALFSSGHCHTVEVYDQDQLVGGLYGVCLGGAFFGESMFSERTNASKIALVHLVARLMGGQFNLLDTQFTTDHLKRFGAIEISRQRYHLALETALDKKSDFFALPSQVPHTQALDIIDAYQKAF